MKKAVAIILIMCFALVTIVGILQQIMAGPTMNRIPIAFLIPALCGLFSSVLSIRPIFLSNKMLMVSVAIAIVLIVCFVLRPEPSVRGAQDARRDATHERYILLDYGFPFGVQPETEQCLRQHGLEVRVVGLDIMDKSELPYYESYISVMDSVIKSRFGPDVFDQCENAARKRSDCRPSECKAKLVVVIRRLQQLPGALIHKSSFRLSARRPALPALS